MISNNIKFKIMTVGCPVNQSESLALKNIFEKVGLEESSNMPADIYVINSCVVTQAAARKSRKKAKVALKENENAVIVMMGCYGEIAEEDIKEKVPEVDLVIGTKGRKKIVELAIDLYNKKHKNQDNGLTYNMRFTEDTKKEKNNEFEELGITAKVDRKRPVVKIQEGCNQGCSFCVVTIARGKPKSRKLKNIKKEVKSLVKNQYKEIILAGTNMGLYGKDIEKDFDLALLLQELASIEGDFRIRLSSLEPVEISENVLYSMKENKKICNHLYLPLQSGSEKVLRAMKRNYNKADFAWIVERARDIMPEISIITDIIVGFPGETEKDHKGSMEFIKHLELDKLHVFPYSPRPKTEAAKYKNQVRPDVKTRRVEEMKGLGNELSYNFHQKQKGQLLQVLTERCNNFSEQEDENILWCEGFSENYAFICFKFPTGITKEKVLNKVVNVRASRADAKKIIGEGINFLY